MRSFGNNFVTSFNQKDKLESMKITPLLSKPSVDINSLAYKE